MQRGFTLTPVIAPVIALAAGLAIMGTANAQGFGRLADVFAGADSNHDGRVDRAEFIAARSARFDELDRNRDGVISAGDLPGIAAFGTAQARMARFINGADANHDGKVTRAELAQAPTAMFTFADANHDGFVDQGEIKTFRANASALRESR